MNDLALSLHGVRKRYPDFALGDIDLELESGQIMGFIGPNGAGKSTTLRIIMGLIQQDAGECTVLGRSMPGQQVAARRDIGFVSDDMRLYAAGTLRWHMDFVASLFPTWDESYAHSLAARFELRPAQRLARFSHGERVKAMLLLALARRPRLLVLDEPSTGLDPVARHEVVVELMDVLRDENRTILFSSHNTRDVEQISDQIAFIDRGRLIACSDKESFLERWRRLRLTLAADRRMPDLPGLIEMAADGRSVVATVNRFAADANAVITAAGAELTAIEPLTLEEIFLATIRIGRAGEGA